MSIVLPQSINYTEALPSLPEQTIQIPVAANPTNGQTFQSGQQIIFDFLNRGFLVPDSIYLSYTYVSTNAAAVNMIGCPVYTPIARVDVQAGSQTIDTISNYNVVMGMLTNLTLDVAQKYGQQNAFGYSVSGTPTIEELDGRTVAINEGAAAPASFSGPLMTILSNAEKLLPLFCMPQMRIILTVESLANMFNGTAATNFVLSNVELRYKIVDMGSEVENMVRGMGDKIYIKSQSFSSSSATLGSGASGAVELIFNQRYASVKSLYAINGNSTGNRFFDSVSLVADTAGADYGFIVGGVNYPQRPISTKTNKAGALQELRSAIGSVFDKNNSLSINSAEFNRVLGDATSVTVPGKFFIATSTEKISSNNLLTGISTQNSPISYRINLGTATAAASTITLIVNFDTLFEVDTVNRQLSIKS